jgi:hypothetical protein
MWYPSKYGADDILGAMNLITPDTILAALSIVRKGIVYDLSHDLDQDMPIPGFHGAFFANTQFTLENGAEWHDRHLGIMKNGRGWSRRTPRRSHRRISMTAESRAIGSAAANFFGPHFDPAVRIQKQKKGWQLHLARLTVSCYGNVY